MHVTLSTRPQSNCSSPLSSLSSALATRFRRRELFHRRNRMISSIIQRDESFATKPKIARLNCDTTDLLKVSKMLQYLIDQQYDKVQVHFWIKRISLFRIFILPRAS